MNDKHLILRMLFRLTILLHKILHLLFVINKFKNGGAAQEPKEPALFLYLCFFSELSEL